MGLQSIKALQTFYVSNYSRCNQDLTAYRLWFSSLCLLSSEYVDYWDRRLGA
jgi:hypothetical protein